jgi:predicted dinucleotide-utilizing enzyme
MGKDLIRVSAGGFLAIPDLAELAQRHGARVQIASGAMPGLDILRCAAEGAIRKLYPISCHFAVTTSPDPARQVRTPALRTMLVDSASRRITCTT